MKVIDVGDIDVGIPKFQWLMGRMEDDEFRSKHGDVYAKLSEQGFTSRASLLDFLEEMYEKYLSLPILVEEYVNQGGEVRYRLRDGYRRLTVLAMRRGVAKVRCELYRNGMTKRDWEFGRLIDLKLEMGMIEDLFPQKPQVRGEAPFNLWFEEGGEKSYIDSFMISTGFKVPYILKSYEGFEARGDDFEGEWKQEIEFLVGVGKHEPIAKALGTHPFNTYLVGHFACGPNAERDPLVRSHGRFVRIQQYFRAGYWGRDVPNYKHNGVPTVKEQLAQNDIAIPILFKLGILKLDTKIYFADQSADKPCPLEQYFKLFQGEDCLRQYYRWLPTYFRNCRAGHFRVPVEEVVKCIPKI